MGEKEKFQKQELKPLSRFISLLWMEGTSSTCWRSVEAFKQRVHVIIFALGVIAMCAIWHVLYILCV